VKKYKPEELYFCISDRGLEHDKEDFPYGYICFTTKLNWEKEKCMSDDLGSHNMPTHYLSMCGIEEVEEMESVFSLTGEYPPNEVEDLLLSAGFEKNEEFSKFLG
jgi:hypothetical protein